MADLRRLLDHLVAEYVPGAVALVDRDGDVEWAASGRARADGTPMARDTVFRIASLTKPMIAAVTMTLVEDGTLALDDPASRWLPEWASPAVLRTPGSPLDDVVPAEREITVEDLLTFRHGLGFPTDFSFPVVRLLFEELFQGPPQPQVVPPPDEWMRRVREVPLLHQPGAGWTYNTGADLLGVLLARASGRSLPELLHERVFDPLGMGDTGFHVPAADVARLADYWVSDDAGTPQVQDSGTDSQWASAPAFPSGAGGLVSTLDDCWRFERMLRGDGTAEGVRVLTAESVAAMTTDRLTPVQKEAGGFFLDGQGWGYCGSVDGDGPDVWNQPGRYGWVGGTGTAAHVVRATGLITVLLTQLQVGGPSTGPLLHEFWTYAVDG